MNDRELKVLIFHLDDDIFAVPIGDICEVVRPLQVRKIQKGPEYILGIINFHGSVAPIVDFKFLLDMGISHVNGNEQMWLAVEYTEGVVCMLIDRFSHFLKVTDNMLESFPVISRGSATKYITHYFKEDNRLIPILAMQHLLEDKISEIKKLK